MNVVKRVNERNEETKMSEKSNKGQILEALNTLSVKMQRLTKLVDSELPERLKPIMVPVEKEESEVNAVPPCPYKSDVAKQIFITADVVRMHCESLDKLLENLEV